ncbi:MAG: hypothetical protein DRJ34_02900 [Thermoprotei archaeon]|nr:MAG: hypothetical protein DRJ34_02900 [Thermoprotei archaeon]
MVLRKIIKIGSSYYIALPKKWVLNQGLSENSYVYVNIRDGRFVEISPTIQPKPKREFKINVRDRDILIRKVLAAYLSGCDIIEISLDRLSKKYLDVLDDLLRVLVGVEIVEEDENKVLIQCFIRSDYDPILVLRRMDSISRSMYRDVIKALVEWDIDIAESVYRRDDRVDRLYFLIVRLLRTLISSPEISSEDKRFFLDLRMIAKNLEQIGDYSTQISSSAKKIVERGIKISEKNMKSIEIYSKNIENIQKKLIQIVTDRNLVYDEMCIKSLIELENKIDDIMETTHGELYDIFNGFKGIIGELKDVSDLISEY